MKTLKLLIISCLFISYNAHAFGLNDLSILIPLPKNNEISLMLSPSDSGNNGALLSKSVYNRFFSLVVDRSKEEIWTNQLKVVAIRIDPCFIEGTGPLACRRQIRLVWQPIFLDKNDYSTRDASLHSFYEFSDQEYKAFLTEWKTWAKTDVNLPLVIHPLLQKESLSGPHWNKLRSLILNFCGVNNLIRMTSMNVMGSAQLWLFSGFDIDSNGVSKEMVIARINETVQSITQSSFDINHFWGALNPAPMEDAQFNLLIEDSMFFKKQNSPLEVKKAIRSLLTFENPKKTNTGNLDCASCHLANMAHQWTKKNYPDLNWDIEFRENFYTSDFNLQNTTHGKVNPNQFRILGYFGKEPVISQRVINETSEVLKSFK